MKVLVIAATPFFSNRGCHIRIYNEAKCLKKLGNEIKICAYHIGNDVAECGEISRIGNSGWYSKISPGFSWGKIWLDLKLFFLCLREIKKFNPDIIHAHLFEGLAIGHLAKIISRKKIPLVADLQGDLSEEFRSYNKSNTIARKIFTRLSKVVINWADYAVISSENAQKSVEDIFKHKNRISVIRDGIDLEFFNCSDPRLREDDNNNLKEIKAWKDDKKLLIYAGSVEESKGVGNLISRFVRYSSDLTDWKLLVVGYGKNLEEYRSLVLNKNLGDQIKFTGEVSYFELPDYLHLADVAIDPKNQTTEASGKLAGYMASNLPVICFDTEFNRKILGDKGFYLTDMENLSGFLCQKAVYGLDKMVYAVDDFNEDGEAKKLHGIFISLIG